MSELYTAREIIEAAITKEQLRRGFYSGVAQQTENQDVSKLFALLAAEELKHVETFTKMRDGIPEDTRPLGFDEEMQAYLQVILDDQLSRQPDVEEMARKALDTNTVISLALRLEKDSILFFVEFLPYLSTEDKAIVRQLIDEERTHIRKLIALRARL